MSRTHLTRLTMLFVATIGTLASATTSISQTPAPVVNDSTAKDSVKPKKSGRFGGLMNKAKAVAGNKTVQAAVKVAGSDAVKSVATGVACTVVPGAAVVSAATGQGPCAGGIMAGLISGNGLGFMSGLSNAAATASAMKLMKNSGSYGMSNIAAAAAAAKLMQTNGLSNAASLATMKNAGMSSADVAAAMKMMQANGADMTAALKQMQTSGVLPPAPAATSNVIPAGSAVTSVPAALRVNYDFVPGERVIYYSDFTDDQVGNFPARLEFVEGNMEVAELGGRRVMRATSRSIFIIPLPENLPQRFTIEIDVINRPSLDGTDFYLRGKPGRIDDVTNSMISWGSDGAALLGGGGGEVKLSNNEANRVRYRGKPAQLRILGDGKYIKVYLDEKRLANVPNANFERSKVLHVVVDARSEDNAAYIGRIRVAESRKSIYDDLVAAGRVATQGLLFDTGSDKLRPESTPTLKLIAGMLEQHPDLRLRIEGHTDNVGAKDANRALSDKRAAAVKAALIGEYRIAAERLESKGFGDTKPAATNATPEGKSNNRRVELVKM